VQSAGSSELHLEAVLQAVNAVTKSPDARCRSRGRGRVLRPTDSALVISSNTKTELPVAPTILAGYIGTTNDKHLIARIKHYWSRQRIFGKPRHDFLPTKPPLADASLLLVVGEICASISDFARVWNLAR